MKKILLILFGLFLLTPISIKAQSAQEQILSFDQKTTINIDSTVDIRETIKYTFPAPKHGIFRYIPNKYKDASNNKYFKTPITNISVINENNNAYQFSQSQVNNNLELQIGDPNRTITGEHIYIISYKVTGVINYFSDHDEFYWNVTGNRWQVPINNVTAEITLPTGVDKTSIQEKCYTGKTGSTDTNCSYNYTNSANFSSKTGPLTAVLGWNKGVIDVITRQYQTSFRHESPWFWLIFLVTFILLLVTYFRKGKDPFGRGTIAPEFDAPDGLLPAEIGVIIDEKVDNKDISATIIDFAVRGYLKIKNNDGKYSLIKTKDADIKMKEYEKELFTALFSSGKELDISTAHINNEIKTVKSSLYKDLTEKKYFAKSPDKVRGDYLLWGFLVIFFSGIFFWLSWHLVFALFFSGLLIFIFSKFMPKKTKEGVILKEKSLGLKEFLYRADRYKLKWQEKQEIFEKFLPYAMILGVVDQWAKNFKNIYTDPPDWYQGNINTFSAIYIANEMSHFSSTASSSYSPPAASGSSGFGSGGSSGGGFGGGGGGSW